MFNSTAASTTTLTIDRLAEEIRRVDGNHSMGAGALAEALMPFLQAQPASSALLTCEWNKAIEAAARRIEGGSFLHDQAPDKRFADEVVPVIRSMKHTAPTPIVAVLEGWKCVPEIMTDDMLRAARNQRSGGRIGKGDQADWEAILAAVPAPAAPSITENELQQLLKLLREYVLLDEQRIAAFAPIISDVDQMLKDGDTLGASLELARIEKLIDRQPWPAITSYPEVLKSIAAGSASSITEDDDNQPLKLLRDYVLLDEQRGDLKDGLYSKTLALLGRMGVDVSDFAIPVASVHPAGRAFLNLEGLADRLLAPRLIVRDPDGYLVHPDVPVCDESVRTDVLLSAFGLETAYVSMEGDCEDEDLVERVLVDAESCLAWTPTPPEGKGWVLLEIFANEDGPHAMFVREALPPAKSRSSSSVASPKPREIAPSGLLDCEIAARPLEFSLREYHRAPGDGPLHATWEDKPHRIVYDLIAAVKFYAALAASPTAVSKGADVTQRSTSVSKPSVSAQIDEGKILEVAARLGSQSLHVTRAHEIGGKTRTIMEEAGLIEFAQALAETMVSAPANERVQELEDVLRTTLACLEETGSRLPDGFGRNGRLFGWLRDTLAGARPAATQVRFRDNEVEWFDEDIPNGTHRVFFSSTMLLTPVVEGPTRKTQA